MRTVVVVYHCSDTTATKKLEVKEQRQKQCVVNLKNQRSMLDFWYVKGHSRERMTKGSEES